VALELFLPLKSQVPRHLAIWQASCSELSY